jgi:hypothetical protein
VSAVALHRRDGVERDIHLTATSAAFVVTVAVAGGYGVFEVVAGAPRLPMWSVFAAGTLAWAVASSMAGRRAR